MQDRWKIGEEELRTRMTILRNMRSVQPRWRVQRREWYEKAGLERTQKKAKLPEDLPKEPQKMSEELPKELEEMLEDMPEQLNC